MQHKNIDMKKGRNVPISPFLRNTYDDCNRLWWSGLRGIFLKVPKPVLPGALKSCGKKQVCLFLVVVERLGDVFLESILRVAVRRGGRPAEGGEDGGTDAIESAGQRLAVPAPSHQQKNGGDDYQVRLALLVLGEGGAEGIEERLPLGAVESARLEDGAEVGIAPGLEFLIVAEFLRRYGEVDLNGRLAAVVRPEGVASAAGAELDAEFVCVAEETALRGQPQLVQAVGHVLDGLQLDELAAMDQFGVAGDVKILNEDLHVLFAEQGIGREVIFVLDEGSAVDENTVHNLPEGLGQNVHREMLVHVGHGLLAVVILLQKRQCFGCRSGEFFQGCQ